MITPAARGRFLKDERGFTLTEVLVTIMIMIVVMSALSSMFHMSLRVFSYGNNKVEAVESARVGLEKMEREIRQAYTYNSASSPTYLFFDTASPTSPLTVPPTTREDLTFGNDFGGPGAGDGVITCGSPCEFITYKLTDSADDTVPCTVAPCTLRRVNTSSSADAGVPVVENVAADGLTFEFLQSDGATSATDESDIGIVLVSLTVSVDKGLANAGTQTLTTAIDLRNR